jgi:hypothetical protein
MTIQDVFAKIGGFANAVFILIKALTYYYIRFKYLFFIKSITEQEKEKIKLESKNEIPIISHRNELSSPKVSRFKLNNESNQIKKFSVEASKISMNKAIKKYESVNVSVQPINNSFQQTTVISSYATNNYLKYLYTKFCCRQKDYDSYIKIMTESKKSLSFERLVNVMYHHFT